MTFTASDYQTLHRIVFFGNFPGYRPSVKEVPNGDGNVDVDKRYAHVAAKYLTEAYRSAHADDAILLDRFLDVAHSLSIDVARALEVPTEYMPVRDFGALRVLEYPPNVGGHAHTDFDLFTLSLYRSDPKCLVLGQPQEPLIKTPKHSRWCAERDVRLSRARLLNPGLHIGEMGEIIGLAGATPHHVAPSETLQLSIVYFAIPDHSVMLPNSVTVGDWLAERISRSRVY
jgi:hypothetical protein